MTTNAFGKMMGAMEPWEREKFFIDRVNLVGKKIEKVRYMTEKEAEERGWDKRCIILVLDDGTEIYPQRDDEGNDAGALVVDDYICPLFK